MKKVAVEKWSKKPERSWEFTPPLLRAPPKYDTT